MKEKYWIIGLAAAVLMGGLISLYASSNPDGLEWVLEEHGLEEAGGEHLVDSPMADYQAPWIGGAALSASFAGVFGVVLIFALGILLGKLLKKKSGQNSD